MKWVTRWRPRRRWPWQRRARRHRPVARDQARRHRTRSSSGVLPARPRNPTLLREPAGRAADRSGRSRIGTADRRVDRSRSESEVPARNRRSRSADRHRLSKPSAVRPARHEIRRRFCEPRHLQRRRRRLLRSEAPADLHQGAVDVFQSDGANTHLVAQVSTPPGGRTSLFVPELDRLFVAVRARLLRSDASILVFRPTP